MKDLVRGLIADNPATAAPVKWKVSLSGTFLGAILCDLGATGGGSSLCECKIVVRGSQDTP